MIHMYYIIHIHMHAYIGRLERDNPNRRTKRFSPPQYIYIYVGKSQEKLE